MDNWQLKIDAELAHHLVTTQFPQWKELSVRPVAIGGHDNRTFHLGEHMLVRMPSAEEYAANVEKEQKWLPRLAPLLPFPIPVPLAMGKPGEGYPWHWSIYRWLEGETAAIAPIANMYDFATRLAYFLTCLQRIDPTDGPLPGPHNFYRGGDLATYDAEIQQALATVRSKMDVGAATEVWKMALATTWQGPPVWVHGNVSIGNLLVQKSRLSAVIDFGQLAVGDPACDLVIAWALFRDESREVFRALLPLDADTWARGRAWALWKALIVVAGFVQTNAVTVAQSWLNIEEVLADFKCEILRGKHEL